MKRKCRNCVNYYKKDWYCTLHDTYMAADTKCDRHQTIEEAEEYADQYFKSKGL